MTLRVHSFIESSQVNGPGRRAVLWLQGCSLGCANCWNPSTHLPSPGSQMSITDLATWVCRVWDRYSISGLTVTGGEPMEQARALAAALETLRNMAPALSIGLFSGYSETELNRGMYQRSMDSAERKQDLWQRIRRQLDFADPRPLQPASAF